MVAYFDLLSHYRVWIIHDVLLEIKSDSVFIHYYLVSIICNRIERHDHIVWHSVIGSDISIVNLRFERAVNLVQRSPPLVFYRHQSTLSLAQITEC